jgi:ABC-type nitrate/sulfonate/bicarbonate transport system permease component
MPWKTKNLLPPLALVLGFFLMWEAFVRLVGIPFYILPAPSGIFQRVSLDYELLFQHTLTTLIEVLVGFVVAFILGVSLALFIFYSKTLERALYPLIIASQTIPLFAIAPLLILWFGYGLAPKVIVAVLIAFFPIVVNTVDGLKSADEDMINLLRVLEAKPHQILLKVRIPAALPFVFSGVKIGITLSVVGAMIGEWVGAMSGLGYLMLRANAMLKTDLVFAAMLWLSALGVLLFALVSAVEWLTLPWRRVSSKQKRRPS